MVDVVYASAAVIVSDADTRQCHIDLQRWWICILARLLPLKLISGWLSLE